MNNNDKVLCRTKGHVLYITINRPERMNSIDTETNHKLEDALNQYAADDSLWVAVIRGAGDKAFSAGGDIKAMNEAIDGDAEYKVPKTGYGGLTSRFDLDKPVIAAVNGLAMGGGFEIALAADLIIAAEHATFGLPEPLIGVVAYAGGMHRLPREIGIKRAMQILLACETIDANKAMDWGLVNEVVPSSDLDQTVERWVKRLLKAAPLAVRATKQCVQRGISQDIESVMTTQESGGFEALEAMRNSKDILEGITAFATKRAPQWRAQ
jgi:enoyl-CoA hydratase/carnithine racemase